jgi:hypothetical protein
VAGGTDGEEFGDAFDDAEEDGPEEFSHRVQAFRVQEEARCAC